MKASRRPAFLVSVAAFAVLALSVTGLGQAPATPSRTATASLSSDLFAGLKFRNIGPATMGGRIDDFAVLESHPAIFYVAAATGGLWKTVNNGTTWETLFDDLDEVVSIGDVAIAPNDPNLVWVGSGENNNRQSSSWGNGVYKSTDGGRTWKHMGLSDSKHIARVIVDPVDHDVVYVAALGHLWGPNKERGIYKTIDGGLSWTNVLFVNEDTGATELVMDPSNNKVLYAATYQRRRAVWGFNGGGPGSAIYKSTDAGKTWTRLTNGIPDGALGRIGLDVYRRNPDVLYARIEHAKESGVYRSDDAGASWKKMSDTNPRPMYFSQIRIDPNDDHRIYVLGVQLHISDDGGKTFVTNGVLHSDHHAMWIDPNSTSHIITGNDGGVGISYDRGRTWDFVDNLDLGQFYHVGYDMETPYHVYGGLQDNYSWGGPSESRSRFGIANSDWIVIGGGDGFVALADPRDSRTLYSESQDGRMVRVDRITNERKVIRPEAAKGEPALRWNWNTPMVISPHASGTVFVAANRVFKSTDRGHSWKAISPDLTAAVDRETLSLMGVTARDFTIAKHDGVAAYGTIVAFAESPRRAGLYYAGADDGTVHVSRDDGANWTNITSKFPGLPKNTYVSRLQPSGFDDATVYATFDGHRQDDYGSYVYVSTDYGSSWKSIASGLPTGQTAKCIAEDVKNANVLYLGTELGLFVSLDRGARWTRLRSNLPTVPIDEITLHPRDNDMILATHGRSIWILDDLTPIQHASEALSTDAHLFAIAAATQFNRASDRTDFAGNRRFWGRNPEPGAAVTYYLKEPATDLKVTVRAASGEIVREIDGEALKDAKKAGINRVYWDLRHPPLPTPRSQQQTGGGFFGASLTGPFVLPGEYRVTLSAAGKELGSRPVRVEGDPLIEITDADRKTLHDVALMLHDMQRTVNEAADAVSALADQMSAIDELLRKTDNAPNAVKGASDELRKRIAELRRQLGVPAPGQAPAGGFGFGSPNVRSQIGALKGAVIASTSLPTETQTRVTREARDDLAKVVAETNSLITTGMPGLYRTLAENNIQPVLPKPIRTVTVTSSQQR